jgi:hypothetical protein
MILEQLSTGSRRKRQWRESKCPDPWCRNRTAEQYASNPREQIPFISPMSTNDGERKCCLTQVSGASGSRKRAAAPKLHLSTGCSLITSKNSAMAAHPSIQPTVNAFAADTTPARRCKSGRRGWELEGGRGFISLQRGNPATAPDLMRRFFSRARTFDYFSGNQKNQTANLQFAQANQSGLDIRSALYSIYFLGASADVHLPKKRREIPGGGEGRGCVMTAFSEGAR